MLISSSRKPAPKTRSFCKNLGHTFGYEYVSRGKSSLRDLGLKSEDLGHKYVLLVYELEGNPSKLSFFTNDGNEILSLKITAKISNERLFIKPKELKFKFILPGLEFLKTFFDFPLDSNIFSNSIEINESKNLDEIANISFINDKGEKSKFEITIRRILFIADELKNRDEKMFEGKNG
ncbi:hypothetical protein [Methanobrevibacter curvatus]|uniref:Probable Brix domain-containing ribosomal biogenesis protein n=1 Tax=Methanobrevibacter curvatus TaxID=49547 RepID=A0A165YYT0_9EURY|nr:hypothetical protein [Methanobrevibacter curvatus]KZX10042.1 ribosomal biogenesis protein [Methanobrevibacter curvatus]